MYKHSYCMIAVSDLTTSLGTDDIITKKLNEYFMVALRLKTSLSPLPLYLPVFCNDLKRHSEIALNETLRTCYHMQTKTTYKFTHYTHMLSIHDCTHMTSTRVSYTLFGGGNT